MANDFEKWFENVDLEGLTADIEDAKQNNGGTREFEKVPHGNYEVKIDKIEAVMSKSGKPMVSVWFTIIEGKYKNQKLFMNQVTTQGFQFHIVKEFLKSLQTGLDIEFVNPSQWEQLMLDVAEECDAQGLEYAVKYEDNKGYDKFTITEVFEG